MPLPASMMAGALVLTPHCAAVADHTPSEAARNLYDVFPSSQPGSIARGLTQTLQSESRHDGGTLILYIGSGIYAYDRSDRSLTAGIATRSDEGNGNFELTAVSHIGPAIAYLATMRAEGDDGWRDHAQLLKTRIEAFQKVNAASNWLADADAPAFAGRDKKIRDMIDYACRYAVAYLEAKLSGDGTDFTPEDVQTKFFEPGTGGYPIGYDAVMVGTFALAVLQDADEIASALRAQEEAGKLDWSRTRIVIFQHIGNNYGAGLTPQTNWGVDLLMRLGGNKLAANAIYIAPYLEQREGIGDDPLPQETFTYYDRAWQSVADRLKASNKAFAQIKTIEVPPPAPILGDWGLTKADDLDAFVRRLKYTFENGNQLVSNATSFWIPGALEAVGWDPMKVTLPGFDTGFPDGVDGYPPMSVQQ